MCPWSSNAVISSTDIFIEIDNNTLYGSKLYIFMLWQKSLDIKIMFHEDICTVNISKLNYWLVICIAKNFIWTTLKVIFSIFWFFLLPRILVSSSIICDFFLISLKNILISSLSAKHIVFYLIVIYICFFFIWHLDLFFDFSINKNVQV